MIISFDFFETKRKFKIESNSNKENARSNSIINGSLFYLFSLALTEKGFLNAMSGHEKEKD